MQKAARHNTLPLVSRRIAVLMCLVMLALTSPAHADVPKMAPEMEKLANEYPKVVLVTMGVGALIWERHGHIALCIEYENRSENACYNYGVGDFANPGAMFWGFFRGSGAFWVDEVTPGRMLSVYRNADRTIWVQYLPLTQVAKAAVIKKLKFDILPENKHYSYDHFWDNCTTRVRDILDDVTDHALSKMVRETDGRTYRDLALEGFYGMKVPRLITDLAMGRVTDRVPSYYERMFLPDYLREAAESLWYVKPVAIYERKGLPALLETEMRLADPKYKDQHAALQKHKADLEGAGSGRLIFVFVVLLLTAPAWATRLWGRFQRTGLAIAVIPPVLLGSVFWFLALISPLPYVRWNESCLALMPFDLLLLFLPQEKRVTYAKARVAMLGMMCVLLLINVLKAPIWPAVIWALVPNLVVAFLPMKAAPKAEKAAPAQSKAV